MCVCVCVCVCVFVFVGGACSPDLYLSEDRLEFKTLISFRSENV